jgi:hypothetical protein
VVLVATVFRLPAGGLNRGQSKGGLRDLKDPGMFFTRPQFQEVQDTMVGSETSVKSEPGTITCP